MKTDPGPAVAIRDVADADMATITDIYSHAVLNGVSSWEYDPPDLTEMIRRRDAILAAAYPYRVAEHEGAVAGYAYASAYRPRPGYTHTVETSIYVAPSTQRLGVGRQLLADLIAQCEDRGYRQAVAIVGDSENIQSIDFHLKMGFEQVGLVRSIGFKFGRWMDQVILQKALGEGDGTLP